jgi:hypothetical protein
LSCSFSSTPLLSCRPRLSTRLRSRLGLIAGHVDVLALALSNGSSGEQNLGDQGAAGVPGVEVEYDEDEEEATEVVRIRKILQSCVERRLRKDNLLCED